MDKREVCLKEQGDIVLARQTCREVARELGFGSADQTRLATAVSELARNVLQYAQEGVCIIADVSTPEESIVHIVVEDHGPGIADVDQAMDVGFSTGEGLGAGLPGAKRLAHEFSIDSGPGHTVVRLTMTRKKTGP